MSGSMNRRAALGVIASVPALGFPAVALTVAAPPPALAALIEAHRLSKAAFYVEIDALEAAEPDREAQIECLGAKRLKVGFTRPDDMHELVDKLFDGEAEKLATLAMLAPEIAEAARGRLAEERAASHARIDAFFADYRAAEVRYRAASEAEEDALTAICAHRCASFEELAEKARFLLRYSERNDLTDDQYDAVIRALLPEGEGLDDIAA